MYYKKITSKEPFSTIIPSKNSPFSVALESGNGHTYFCAISLSSIQDPDMESIIQIDTTFTSETFECHVIWSRDGDYCALLQDYHFVVIFDFNSKTTYARASLNKADSTWKHVTLEWSETWLRRFPEIAFDISKSPLKKAIISASQSHHKTPYLVALKHLLSEYVLVPITLPESNTHHEYFVFPYQNQQNILCLFCTHQAFHGYFETPVNKKQVHTPSLFKLLCDYPEIDGVLVIATAKDSIYISKTDFPLLSISQQDTSSKNNTLFKMMNNLLLDRDQKSLRNIDYTKIKTLLKNKPYIQEAHFFRSKLQKETLLLGLLTNHKDSKELVALYRDLIAILNTNKNTPAIEITRLKEGEVLLSALRAGTLPFYVAEKKTSKYNT